jgi:hypothetical protein
MEGLYKDCTFCSHPLTNMATTDDSDWSISKKSPLKPHGQMIRNLVGSIYGKFSYKDCSFCPNLLGRIHGRSSMGNADSVLIH